MTVRKNHDNEEERNGNEKNYISESVLTITLGVVIIVLAILLVFG